MYHARRAHKLNALVGTLKPWSHGLTVAAGEYVQSYGNAYQALTSGTTGTSAPATVEATKHNDGGVTWIFVNNRSLLQYLGGTPPTPA